MAKNNMTNRDKVAMLLTTKGLSLEEGLKIYDDFAKSEKGYSVVIDRDNDVVVWLDQYTTENGTEVTNLSIWLNYRKDFCDNYALVGAFALDDEELGMEDSDDKDAFMDFFRKCKDTSYNDPTPLLPDELKYIFTLAAITDYMGCDTYEIGDETEIKVTSNAKPVF